MVMAGEKFKPHTATIQLDGKTVETNCPFETVYIHGTVLDTLGRRMSKSAGNGIDPIELIDQYGSDAVRFSLMMLETQGQDIKLAADRMEMGKEFANKLWNAVRLAYSFIKEDKNAVIVNSELHDGMNYWIRFRLKQLIKTVTNAINEYNFRDGVDALYIFVWNDFCDNFLEFAAKRQLRDLTLASETRAEFLSTLNHVVDVTLRLLHPYMPSITEELWHLHPLKQCNASEIDQQTLLITEKWPISEETLILRRK